MTPSLTSILNTTAERFDAEFCIPGTTSHLHDQTTANDLKDFIHSEQLTLLAAVKEMVEGMKEEDNYSSAYADYTEKKAVENSKAILNYNHALRDVIKQLEVNDTPA